MTCLIESNYYTHLTLFEEQIEQIKHTANENCSTFKMYNIFNHDLKSASFFVAGCLAH